jgi:hypothetical protein
MTDQWHQPIRHIRGHDLGGDTAQTSGMARFEAIVRQPSFVVVAAWAGTRALAEASTPNG